MNRLAIVTSHPIQYNAPLFKLLSSRGRVEIKVFYTWGQSENTIFDPDFKLDRKWDIPLLEGYDYEFLRNVSTNPGSHHFWGIINPDAIAKINNFKPDALLIFGWAFFSHLKIIRYFKGKKILFFRGDSTLIDEQEGFSIKKHLRKKFLKFVYSYIDFAFFTGIENRKYFCKYGLKEKQLIYAPHSIDNIRFHPNPENIKEANQLRRKLSIEKNDLVFLFAGKLQEKKDPLTLINAFNKLEKSGSSKLIIVGDGNLKDQLILLSNKKSNIFFLPFQNQSIMPSIYQMCDVFVLPSKGPGETWGLAINEAMASGKAIITTNKVGGAFDLIINSSNGYIVSAGNELQLKQAMYNFIEKRDLCVTFGKESIRIIKFFTFDIFCQEIEKALNPASF